jgi:hypothetical protein
VDSLRGGWPKARVGASDPCLTSVSGMAAVTELVERLGVIPALDAAVGPIKQRDRGFGAGEVLVGLARRLTDPQWASVETGWRG